MHTHTHTDVPIPNVQVHDIIYYFLTTPTAAGLKTRLSIMNPPFMTCAILSLERERGRGVNDINWISYNKHSYLVPMLELTKGVRTI